MIKCTYFIYWTQACGERQLPQSCWNMLQCHFLCCTALHLNTTAKTRYHVMQRICNFSDTLDNSHDLMIQSDIPRRRHTIFETSYTISPRTQIAIPKLVKHVLRADTSHQRVLHDWDTLKQHPVRNAQNEDENKSENEFGNKVWKQRIRPISTPFSRDGRCSTTWLPT